MMEPDDIPQEVVDAFVEAWEAKRQEIGRGIAPAGTKVRAGLSAAFYKVTGDSSVPMWIKRVEAETAGIYWMRLGGQWRKIKFLDG